MDPERAHETTAAAPARRRLNPALKNAIIVAAAYAIAALAWITFSDLLVAASGLSPHAAAFASLYKGWAFVVVTTAILFVAAWVTTRRLAAANARLEQANAQLAADEARLRANARTMELALQTGREGTFDVDVAADVGTLSPEFGESLGVGRDPVPAIATMRAIILAEDLPAALEALRAVVADESDRGSCEARVVRPDGSTRWMRVGVAIASRDAEGKPAHIIGTFVDIEDLKSAQQAAAAEAERLRALISASQTPVVGVDLNGDVVLWSPAAERVFGWTAEEAIGQHNPILPEWAEGQYKELRRRIENGEVFHDIDTRRKTKDGRMLDVLYAAGPLRDDEGRFSGVVATITDITALKSAEHEVRELNEGLERVVAERTAQLSEANRELAEVADSKTAFLQSLSHELRTPLNSVIGFTDILLDERPGPVNEEQRRQLGMMRESAQHLLELINEVLDIAKLEAKRQTIEVTRFRVAGLLADCAAKVAPLAAQRGIRLDVRAPLPQTEMTSDCRKVGQIMLNLLANAVRFTDTGVVSVWGKVGPDTVTVIVKDEGLGIPPEDLERIFEDFYQVREAGGPDRGGTGLGLPLSRRLATSLRGTLTVESTPGEGSAFTLALPRWWEPADAGMPVRGDAQS